MNATERYEAMIQELPELSVEGQKYIAATIKDQAENGDRLDYLFGLYDATHWETVAAQHFNTVDPFVTYAAPFSPMRVRRWSETAKLLGVTPTPIPNFPVNISGSDITLWTPEVVEG